jgi:hypothetical protein
LAARNPDDIVGNARPELEAVIWRSLLSDILEAAPPRQLTTTYAKPFLLVLDEFVDWIAIAHGMLL